MQCGKTSLDTELNKPTEKQFEAIGNTNTTQISDDIKVFLLILKLVIMIRQLYFLSSYVQI